MRPAAATPSAAVLVVDDDPLSRDMLIFMLQSADMHAEPAADGLEAIEIIDRRGAGAFQAVFTDVQMPRLGGLDLLEWLNVHAPTTATVIMTANQERELVSASLRGGAVEFLDKPFDLRAVLRASRQALDTHRARLRQQAAATRLRDIADINQRLTRTALVGAAGGEHHRLDLATRFYAINEAGGDLVKAVALEPHRLLLVLGDVSGHGLKEGFLSAYFQGVIEGMARGAGGGREIAEAFNRFLLEEWNDPDPLAITTSLSVCFLELDLRAGEVAVLNCGMPGVLLVDPQGGVSTLAPGGSPLGWFSEIRPAETRVPVGGSGQLWLWSDGLEDHAARRGLAPQALAHHILRAPPHSLAETLLAGADDDIVACCLAWAPRAQPGAEPAPRAPFFHASYAGDALARIDALQIEWTRHFQTCFADLAPTLRHDIVLCLREAMINALAHGCGGRPEKHARMELMIEESPRRLLARITDEGPGFNPDAPRAPSDSSEHISLGLRLIRSLARSVRHSDEGRTIEMEFVLPVVADS